MFKKILIANRGEIACRVIETARKMGITTVAIYSDADRSARHVRMADEAHCVGASPVAESYLNVEAIINVCRRSGAEAVHPGYGFLSENADFAQALTAEGIVFIGPGCDAMRAMGDKITSKGVATTAGVSTVPGSTEVVRDSDHACNIAREIGYPVMIKASAGGGGKGMRVAANDVECQTGFERASSEARTSFGDDRVFIEKFIEGPRHIEIQVLADNHGNIVHLGERECSLQRRHQKVIEEAPSQFLDSATRDAMGAQAVALAAQVGYVSAGTVEFIVDAQRNFFFLEMNTRLQVEHPVTEFVTGLDLVELMFRIAAGEALPFAQSDVSFKGWSMEARIYAEDPFRDFLPSIGRLRTYRPPEANKSLRLDSGVDEGSEVSVYYDPMLAKLISYGADRDEAASRLSRALDEFSLEGVTHNIRFLQCLLNHQRFRDAALTTHFIDEEYAGGFSSQHTRHCDPSLLMAVAAYMHVTEQSRAQGGQLARGVERDWVVLSERQLYSVALTPVVGGCDVVLDARTYELRSCWKPGELLFCVNVNGEPITMQVRRQGVYYRVAQAGAELTAQVLTPRAATLAKYMLVVEPPDLSRFVLSPMPGLLASLAVEVGQRVTAGDEVAVVEAMKMENSLNASRDGVVVKILASVGDSLTVDQPIIELG